MEGKIFDQFKKLLDRVMCCRTTLFRGSDSNIPTLIDENMIEIRTYTNLTVNEDAYVQRIPSPSKKYIYESDEVFKIKNLDSGKEIDIRDENKSSFLQEYSSITDTPTNSENLIEYYSSKQKMNQRLWEAAQNNQIETCKLLLNTKLYGSLIAQVNSRGISDETALHIAAKQGHVAICQILIDLGEKIDVNAKNSNNSTPLHLACKSGQYLVSQLLIRSGGFLNALDDFHNTPLHYAAESGEIKLIKYLFNRFPGLEGKNNQGLTPLSILNSKGIEIGLGPHVEPLSIAQTSDEISSISPGLPKICWSSFEAIQILGRGSFGEVYLVKSLVTDRLYAMKMLRKKKLIDQNLIKYALVERNILSCIRHPFIVKLHYAFQSEDKLYLVLDYCSGGSLTYYLTKLNHFTEDMAKVYMCELVLALEELHRNEIIYRDLKPDNVVIDGQGHALLTDFGLAKQGIRDNCSASSFCGSLAYMAPEMVARKGHGKAVDWYLLGVLFYQMLIGLPPFYSSDREQMLRNIETAKVRVPARVSAVARDLIKKLMKRDPGRRIGTLRGSEEIKMHPFFDGINWESALRRELLPPLVPRNSITPTFVPKYHMNEKPPDECEFRHLNNWSFTAE